MALTVRNEAVRSRPEVVEPALGPARHVMAHSGEPAVTVHRHEVVGAGPALAIEITWDDDQWLAVEATTAAFGEGDTPAEAQEDLLKSLREYRRALEAEPGLLADRLTEHLRLLNTALGE